METESTTARVSGEFGFETSFKEKLSTFWSQASESEVNSLEYTT